MSLHSAINRESDAAAPASTETARAVLDRVRALVPTLQDRAVEAEALRRVPDESIRELDEAGVFKMTVPVEYGGYALLPSQIAPVLSEIARGCGSTGWVTWVTSAGSQWMTCYSHEFQREKFCGGWVGPLQSGAMHKGGPGTSRRAPGGYLVTGKWPWASGCYHTMFHILGALLTNDDGSKEGIVAQVPHDQIEILDDWDVMGMKATGSNTIVLRDGEVFVPEHRVARSVDMFAGKRPAPAPAGVLYKIGLEQFTPGTLAALATGLARAAIERLQARAGGRPITFTDYSDQIKAPVTHLQLGELHVKLETAEAAVERSLRRMERDAEDGVPQTPLDTARIRTTSAYVCLLCTEIAGIALRASGASSIQTSNPLQRIVRDLTTITLNGQMNIETAYEDYGRLIAGLPGFGGPKKPS